VSDAAASASSGEQELAMLAKAFNISMSRNPDGSFNVPDPFDNPSGMAAGIMNTVFNGLIGGGGGDNTDPTQQANSGTDALGGLGLNPLMAQAWTGWGASDPDDPTDATV
jgi:hypothetical protein